MDYHLNLIAMQESFPKKIIVAAIIIILLVGLTALFIYAFSFFLLLFGGLLFGVLLRAATNQLHRFLPIKKGILLVVVLFLILGILFGLGALMAPRIAGQIQEIRETIPSAIENLESQLQQYAWGSWLVEQFRGADISDMMPDQQTALTGAAGALSTTLGVLTDILIIFVLGVLFAAEPKLYVNGLAQLVAPHYRPRIHEVIYRIYKSLAFWLLGKFIAMLVVGILSGIGLIILGVPLAFGLAVIAFLLDFVSMVGPIIAAIPAILLAFLVSPLTALWVVVIYTAIQQFESYVITPLVFKHTIHMSPVLTLASIVFFGILAGPLGLILSIPLVAAIKVMVLELYVKDYLEKGGITPPEQVEQRRENR
jgi:predicted PurR-regulated permease PerM